MPAPKIPLANYLEIVRELFPFTSQEGQAFVQIPIPTGHVLPVRSTAFRDWFLYRAYAQFDTVPTTHALHAIQNLLEARASVIDDNRFPVFRRIAGSAPGETHAHVLLDLGGTLGNLVEISSEGWKTTCRNSPVFEPSTSTGRLPTPQPAPPPPTPAPLDTLRSLLNLPDRAAWLRCLAWLLSAFRPYGPYPFLVLRGPSASGKTFLARVLRGIVDPAGAATAPSPSSVRELLNLARHYWIVALDQLDSLPPVLIAPLCRLSSGLGAAFQAVPRSATLPVMQYFKRPVILGVTSRFSAPPEIEERALTVTLPALPPGSRRNESELVAAFADAWPFILGALCTAVSTALARLPRMETPAGRLPDTLAWALAASPALGCTEDEMRQALNPPPPPHPIVTAIQALLDQRRQFTGTATELLELLQSAGLSCHTPAGISRQLRTCTLAFADAGIELKFQHLHAKRRVIEIHEEPGGAWDSQTPPHAPPDFDAPPQPKQTEELTQ